MKVFKISFTIFLCALLFTGCKKDWLDVNDDPQTSPAADPEFLLYGAQTEYSANRTSEIGLSGAMWSQLWASGQSASVFLNPERYIFSPFTTGNTWRAHYPNSQKNLRFAIEIAQSDQPATPNIAAQAKVMQALIFYSTSILWEDIPFTEAVVDGIDNPKFDSQEDVMNGVLAILDDALAQFDPGDPLVANDHYYSGNITNWIALANSLKFRVLLLMDGAGAGGNQSAALLDLLNSGTMISSNAQSALFPFENKSGNYNPVWNVLNQFAGGANFFYFASEVTVETMKKYDDPRLGVYYDQGPDTNEVVGVLPGTPGDYGLNALLSLNVVQPDAPERVFTYTEQLFLEAEVEYRYGSVANAQQKLNAAITNSMNYWNVPQADIDAYLLNPDIILPPVNGDAAGLQIIAEQTWIAFIDKPIEAWTTWRRLKFPALNVPSGGTLGNDFVRRLPYPPDELSANTNAPGNPNGATPMWFEPN